MAEVNEQTFFSVGSRVSGLEVFILSSGENWCKSLRFA